MSEQEAKMNFEDFVQVCLGSSLLASPVAFTEEVWMLGATLPLAKLALVIATSMTLIGMFVFYGVYEGTIAGKFHKFVSRIFANYLITLLVVGYICFIFDLESKFDSIVGWFKTVILISFPASLSASAIDGFDKE